MATEEERSGKRPFLSILIPTWNRVEHVMRAVRSIGTPPPGLEVVVVDNASAPEVYARLEAGLKGLSHVRLFRNDQNIGMVRNWNRSISLAQGEWMGLLCSDDEYLPGAVMRIYEMLRTVTEPSLVLQDAAISSAYAQYPAGQETAKGLRLPLASGNFWHRQVSGTVGSFDERLEYSPDAEYWYRLASSFPVIKVKAPVARYHSHADNYMWHTWEKEDFLDQCALLTRINCGYILGDAYTKERVEAEVTKGLKQTVLTILEATALKRGKESLFNRYLAKAQELFNNGDISRLSAIISRHNAFLKGDTKPVAGPAGRDIPISFIVTVYNEEARIRPVLEHAIRWADEVIVINKSSTDRTREICLEYGDKVKLVDLPFCPRGHDDTVAATRLAAHDWIFFSTASEIPTYNLIRAVRQLLAETGGELDLVYVPRKYYSFGIHDKRSPWSVSYFPFLINRSKAVVSNTIHRNFMPADIHNTRRIDYSEGCCVYHLTHTSAKDYLSDMTQYFEAEARGCTDPDRKIQECFANINRFEKQLREGGDELFGHYCAWLIYWLGTALFVWEKKRGLDVPELYRGIQQEVLQREWLSEKRDVYEKIRQLIRENKKTDAIAALNRILHDDPTAVEAHLTLGMLCEERGEKKKTLFHYEKALESAPDDMRVMKPLAAFYLVALREMEKALSLYTRILAAAPQDIESLLAVGNICALCGRKEDAQGFYRKVLEISPNHASALENLRLLQGDEKKERQEPDRKEPAAPVQQGEVTVSAIVSTYNSERFVRGCLEDLVSQTLFEKGQLEIIVIDSGSEENERLIVGEFQARYGKIIYVRTAKETVYSAWNRGVKMASGRYLTNANTDDRHRKDALERMASVLDEKREVALVYADVLITETENETFDRHTPVGQYRWHDWDRKILLEKGCFMGPQPMWRRDLHDAYGYFDETMVSSGDYEFWLRISQTNAFMHLKETLGLYLKSPGSIEHRSRDIQVVENAGIIALYREAAEKGEIVRCRLTGEKKTASPEVPGKESSLQVREQGSQADEQELVSVIIAVPADREALERSVRSLAKRTPGLSEVVIIGGLRKEKERKRLGRLLPEGVSLKVAETGKDSGLTKTLNEAIRSAEGDTIVLLKDEVVVADGWIEGLRWHLDTHENAGVASPVTDDPSIGGMSSDNDEPILRYAGEFHERNKGRVIWRRSLTGPCLVFRRDLFNTAGGFDEALEGSRFIEDFCLRAELAGYRNMIAGDVWLHAGKAGQAGRLEGSRRKFDEKWTGIDITRPPGSGLLALRILEKAEEAWNREIPDEAIRTLLEGVRRYPDEKRIYCKLSEMLIESKEFEKGIEILRQIPSAEEAARIQCLRGYCYEGLGEFDQAGVCADQALLLRPGDAQTLNLKGVLAYKKGDRARAADFFRKAAEASPSYGDPMVSLGVLSWSDGKQEEGLELLERGFILDPVSGDCAVLYHSAASAIGEFTRAEKAFAEASSLNPDNRRITFFLIDLLLKEGKYAEAMAVVEDAMVRFGMDDEMMSAALAVRERVGAKTVLKGPGTLSLCMIVKNEEKYLAKCLNSVKKIADEMVIVDTGSSDRTADIARIFGARVFDFPWQDDFAAARNASLEKAEGDWILVLDGDEVIAARDVKEIASITGRNGKGVAYNIDTRNYMRNVVAGWIANDGEYDEEAGSGWFPSTKVRLFPNDRRIRFVNPVHELVEPTLRAAGYRIRECAVPVHHYGKLDQGKTTQKGEAYFLLGMEKLKQDDKNAKAVFELAVQATELGRYDDAIGLWNRLIELRPDFEGAYINAVKPYAEVGRMEEALAVAMKGLALAPAKREAVFHYALCEFYSGNYQAADDVLEGFIVKDPDYPPVLALLAAVRIMIQRSDEGLQLINRLRRMGFNYPEYACLEARKLSSLGRPADSCLLIVALINNSISSPELSALYQDCSRIADESKAFHAGSVVE